MSKHLVRFQHTMSSRLRGDAGQGALEYIGILIIVGLLVVAVLGFVEGEQGRIGEAITNAVDSFLNT